MIIHSFPQQVFKNIKDNALLAGETGIVLAVSGGADSVAMLFSFIAIKDELGIDIKVCHIEHGIRGRSALDDAAFVEKLCADHNIPCTVKHVDVPALVKSSGLSEEEAARKLRYEALFDEGAVVGTAHNAEDNAETVIFNLVRGSGLTGLCGIPVISERQGGRIIRPLLNISRGQIQEYLHALGVDYRTDETNHSRKYARNIIRQDVMPLLRQINSAAVNNINRASARLSEVKEYEDSMLEKLLCRISTGGRLDITALSEYPEYVIKGVAMAWLRRETGGARNIGSVHLDSIYDLTKKDTGRSVDIPGYVVTREYNNLYIGTARADNESLTPGKIKLASIREDEVVFSYNGSQIHIHAYDCKPGTAPLREKYTKQFDYDKIESEVTLRYRQEGDFFSIRDNKTKSFSRFCIDEKIPRGDRDSIPLLCEGAHILWAVGYRISEYYKIDATTKRILEVCVSESEEQEK